MTDPKFVVSRIQFDIAAAIKASNGKLHIDEALIIAGTPCVLIDYATVPNSSLKHIARSMRQFFRRNPRYTHFKKSGVEEGLRLDWLSNLEDEEKRLMLSDFKMMPGVDADGYLIYDPEFVDKLTEKEHPDYERYGSQDYIRVNQNGSVKIIRDPRATTKCYHTQYEDGYEGADLEITEDEWYQIISEASSLIKEYLSCYIQIKDGDAGCQDIEDMFGIEGYSINARNTALGKRAQRMLNIEVYEDETEKDNRRYWSTPMLKGKWKDNNFQWQMRPELIVAAKRLAKQERWELPTRISKD